MAEMARLESVCTLTGYRGFESLSLRKQIKARRKVGFFHLVKRQKFTFASFVEMKKASRSDEAFICLLTSPSGMTSAASNPSAVGFTFVSFSESEKSITQ